MNQDVDLLKLTKGERRRWEARLDVVAECLAMATPPEGERGVFAALAGSKAPMANVDDAIKLARFVCDDHHHLPGVDRS